MIRGILLRNFMPDVDGAIRIVIEYLAGHADEMTEESCKLGQLGIPDREKGPGQGELKRVDYICVQGLLEICFIVTTGQKG